MPPTITHAPLSQPTVGQMPLAALLSALAFTIADLLCRSPLIAPRVSRAFARARAESSEKQKAENETEDGVHRRAREQSLVAVVEDAGIKLVGTLHVLLCLPLAIAVLSGEEETFELSLLWNPSTKTRGCSSTRRRRRLASSSPFPPGTSSGISSRSWFVRTSQRRLGERGRRGASAGGSWRTVSFFLSFQFYKFQKHFRATKN